MKWISVKDELPEIGIDVLMCQVWHFKKLNVGWCTGKRWRTSTGFITKPERITHWMPLPNEP